MNFLGIGPAELVLVIIIALVVLGPERMVETSRTLGRLYARWRQGWGKEVEEMTLELRREIARLQREVDEIRREAERPLKMLMATEIPLDPKERRAGEPSRSKQEIAQDSTSEPGETEPSSLDEGDEAD